MAITFVGSAKGTNTATLPAHQVGDVILVFSWNETNTTLPSLPAGYTSISTNATGAGGRLFYKVATSTSEAIGTLTNCTCCIAHVYRGATIGAAAPISATNSNSATNFGILHPVDPGYSWFAAFIGHINADTAIQTAPGSMTARENQLNAGDEAASFDTNGPWGGWPTEFLDGIGGTAGRWWMVHLELLDSARQPTPPARPFKYRSQSGPTTVTSGNLTLAEPAGAAQGDLLVAAITFRDTPTFTPPAGWTMIEQDATGSNTVANGIAGCAMAYIVRGASAPSYVFTRTAGDLGFGRVICYQPENTTDTITLEASHTVNRHATVPAGAAITTTQDEALVVVSLHSGRDLSSGLLYDDWRATDPNFFTERAESSTASGADGMLAIVDGFCETAGSTGAIAIGSVPNNATVCIVAAFKLVAAGGGTTDAILTSTAAATAAFNAASQNNAFLSSAAAATAAFNAASQNAASLSVTAAATASFVGQGRVDAQYGVSAVSLATFVGQSTASADAILNIAGAATAAFQTAVSNAAQYSMAGVALATFAAGWQGYDTFSNGAGSEPDRWTKLWPATFTPGTTWSEQAAAPGTMRWNNPIATSVRRAVLYDDVPSAVADAEVMDTITADFMVQTGLIAGLIVNAAGTGGSEVGYVGGFGNPSGAGQLIIRKYTPGGAGFTDLATVGFTSSVGTALTTNTKYRSRFRKETNPVDGSADLKLKFWRDIDVEPPGWNLTANDASSPLSAGRIGIFNFANAGAQTTIYNHDWFSYGTGGLSALDPTGGTVSVVLSSVGLATALFNSAVKLETKYDTIAGAATASFVGVGTQGQPFSSAGAAVATFNAAVSVGASLSSQGLATATFVGQTSSASNAVLNIAGSSTVSFVGATNRPMIGVSYASRIHQNVTKFSTFLGYDIALAFEFADKTNKTQYRDSIVSTTGSGGISKWWKDYNTANGKNFRLYLSIVPGTIDQSGGADSITEVAVAAGTHDALWDEIAAKLVADGHEDALIRIGWEMNGNWYSGYYGSNKTNYINAWRRMVDRFRLAAGQAFEFVWSPAISAPNGENPRGWYPGDSYVDWVAPDVYSQQYRAPNLTPQQMWDNEVFGYDEDTQHAAMSGGPPAGTGTADPAVGTAMGVRWFINEARYHNKKFGFGENGSGHSANRHGGGDTEIFWQKIREMLDTWGPSTGGLLGVFEKSWEEVGYAGDYYSTFLESESVTGTPPNRWMKEKDRTAWSFRRYFGILADLPTGSLWETAAPAGMTVVMEPGYGTASTPTLPLGTPDGTKVGQITVSNPDQRIWALDADTQGPLSVTLGWLDGDGSVEFPVGGMLYLRTDEANNLGANSAILGTRNGVGGQNFTLPLSITRVTAAGAPTGVLNFGAATSLRPPNMTARWWHYVNWIDSTVAVGFLRANSTQNTDTPGNRGQRRAMVADGIGAVADIDISTAIRSSAIPPAGTSGTVGGLVVRGDGYATAETGYVFILHSTTTQQQFGVRRYKAGVQFDDPGTTNPPWVTPFVFSANTLYRVHARISATSPVTLKANVWLDGTSEPAGWMIDTVDTSATGGGPITNAGWAGVYAFYWSGSGTTSIDFDWLSWNTTGASSVPQDNLMSSDGTSTAVFVGSVTQTIGGVTIGTIGIPGLPGGVDTTNLKLIYGDDFDIKPTIWNFRNLSGAYAAVNMHNASRRFNDTESQVFLDASYRGSRNQSPTDLGVDPFSVSSSILSITATPRSAFSQLVGMLDYDLNTGVIDGPDDNGLSRDISGQLMPWPQCAWGGQGDWAYEAYIRMPITNPIAGYFPATWSSANQNPDFGEPDLQETWDAAARHLNVTFHMTDTDGGTSRHYNMVRSRSVTSFKFVRVLFLKKGSDLIYYDDNTVPGTMAEVAKVSTTPPDTTSSITRAQAVDRIRGIQKFILDLAISTANGGSGTYNAAQWPQSYQLDWFRIWTPVSQPNNDPAWTYLTEVFTAPGGSWDPLNTGFPSQTALYGAVPAIEEIYILTDNIDNPGAIRRKSSVGNNIPGTNPEGMLIDKTARTIGGTVPMTEGGRVGLVFWGSFTTGGPLKHIAKIFNVAPAEQPGKVFPSCYVTIGEVFSRTIAYTDFHSGNLGPHTYTVSKVSGGAEFSISYGLDNQSATISGTVTNPGVTTLSITCTNAIGQTTVLFRTIDAAARPFHFDFRYGVYRHGTNYADFAAAKAAGKIDFVQSMTANIYAEDLDGFLTAVTGANQPRISNKGLIYEPAVGNMQIWSQGPNLRALTNATVSTEVQNGLSGTKNADRLHETAATGQHSVGGATGSDTYVASFTAGQSYTASQYVKRGRGRRYVQLAMTTNAFPATTYANYDLQTGLVVAQGAGVSSTAMEMEPQLGRGWYRCVLTAQATITATGTPFFVAIITDDTSPKLESYQGVATNFVHLWGAQLVQGVVPRTFINNQTNNGSAASPNVFTKPADDLKLLIETGCNGVKFVFDDGSEQTVMGLTLGMYSVPTTLDRSTIREVIGIPSAASVDASFTSAGVATATFYDTWTVAAFFGMAGSANTNFVAASAREARLGPVAGVSTATFVGQAMSQANSVLNVAGSATASFVGAVAVPAQFGMAGTSQTNFVAGQVIRAAFVISGAFGGKSTASFVYDSSTKPNIGNNKALVDANSNLRRRIPIPDPTEEGGSLQKTSKALKEAVETLQGQVPERIRQAAVTWQDLLNVGVVKPTDEDKAK